MSRLEVCTYVRQRGPAAVRAGIIKDARLVAGCMHRFCSQCIEKWLRMTKRAPRAPGPPACPPAAPLASLPGSLGALCCAARMRLNAPCRRLPATGCWPEMHAAAAVMQPLRAPRRSHRPKCYGDVLCHSRVSSLEEVWRQACRAGARHAHNGAVPHAHGA